MNERDQGTDHVNHNPGIIAVAIVEVAEHVIDGGFGSVDRPEIVSKSSYTNGIEPVISIKELSLLERRVLTLLHSS